MRTRFGSFGIGLLFVLCLSGCWTNHYSRFEGVVATVLDDARVAERSSPEFPKVITLPDGTVSLVADLGWTAGRPAFLVLLLEGDDLSRHAGTFHTDDALAAWFVEDASFQPSDWFGFRQRDLRRRIETTEAHRLGERLDAVPLYGTASIDRRLGDNDLTISWGWWYGYRITVDLHNPASPRIASLVGRFFTSDELLTVGHSLAAAPIGLGMILHDAIEANQRSEPPEAEATPADADGAGGDARSPP